MMTSNIIDEGVAASPFEDSSTSGLVSVYQRTNVTISGAVIASTGESIFIPVIPLPSFKLPSLELPHYDDVCEKVMSKVSKHKISRLMAKGYKSLKKENLDLAEELFPVDIDKWPNWES